MKILAIDLGTHCGLAHNCTPDGKLTAWTEHLATDSEVTQWGKDRRNRTNDPRIARLVELISRIPKPGAVVWEDVQFSSYTLQCQLWASFRTAIWLTLGQHCLLECVPVATLKKFATGHGGATKEMMESALRKKAPEIFLQKKSFDDNAIDAIWIHRWATTRLARMQI